MRKLKGWALEEPLLPPTDPGAFPARGRLRQAEQACRGAWSPAGGWEAATEHLYLSFL